MKSSGTGTKIFTPTFAVKHGTQYFTYGPNHILPPRVYGQGQDSTYDVCLCVGVVLTRFISKDVQSDTPHGVNMVSLRELRVSC